MQVVLYVLARVLNLEIVSPRQAFINVCGLVRSELGLSGQRFALNLWLEKPVNLAPAFPLGAGKLRGLSIDRKDILVI